MAFKFSGKYSNGRSRVRNSRGQYSKPTFKDVFGLDANTNPLVCKNCGYGNDGSWIPLLSTGYCPNCGNQEGHMPFKKETEK